MGYTRYWVRTDKELTADFIEAVKEIIADCESKGIHICGGYGNGEPEVRLGKVWINGDGSKDLDHETIYFDNRPSSFEFCKTARKPYDYALRRILKVAEEEGLITDVSSDGKNDEIINDDGKVIGKFSMEDTEEEVEKEHGQVFKVRMTQTLTLFIEAENENQCMDFINTRTIREVEDMLDKKGVYKEMDYDEEIICPVDGYADIDVRNEF